MIYFHSTLHVTTLYILIVYHVTLVPNVNRHSFLLFFESYIACEVILR